MIRYLVVTAVLGLPASALAQSDAAATLVGSYSEARRTLDAAVEAHGGLEALNAARQIRVNMSGRDFWRNQSRRPGAPYDSEPIRIVLRVDLARGRMVRDQFSAFPGAIRRDSRAIVDSAGNYFVNLRTRTYAPWPPTPQPASRDPNLLLLPQFLLLHAVENVHSLRSLGELKLAWGELVDAISLTAMNQPLTLWFDKNSRRLRGWGLIFRDGLTGDASQEHEYSDYRMVNGVLLPGRRTTRVAGEVTRELDYTSAELNYAIADSLARVPVGFTPDPPASSEPVKQLAEGVWTVNSALAVEFKDHVVVIEPAGPVDRTIARIGELFPNKPIRYVVATHHHDDHTMGIKYYAHNGTTIVTTAGNRAYMTQMATSRGTIGVNAPPLSSPPAIEIVSGRRAFTDGTRTLEVHEIRGNPHADEMLVAWLPKEGILYQGDLIDNASDGTAPPGTNNETTAHFGNWLKAKGWDVRVFTGTHGSLKSPDVFWEILRQPFYRVDE